MAEEPRGRDTWGSRDAAQVKALHLLVDIQSDVAGALRELEILGSEAARKGWGEVERMALIGRAVSAWLSRDRHGSAEAVSQLVEQSRANADDAMLALGLAMSADDGFTGRDPASDAASAVQRDRELARAIVLLERSGGRHLERILAHTACGIALMNRSLFELSNEQHQAALALGPQLPSDAVDALLAPVTFNLAESEVCWAAMLRQVGDRDAISDRLQSWREADGATSEFEMAASWRVELGSLGLLLRAIAGLDVAGEARALLRSPASGTPGDLRRVALLRLAVALADADAGRRGALRETEAAVAALDPSSQPHLYDLATYLAAEIEARRSGQGAGLRCTRRQIEHAWSRRLSALAAMRTLIGGERQAGEIEQLTRHAHSDDLTGIGNRRALSEHLSALERSGVSALAIVLLDIDDFKVVNDRFGHLAGDDVLIGVARLLERHIRGTDLAIRLGGDEFAVVLADLDLATATARAAALLARIDGHRFEDIGQGLRATVSAGVACGQAGDLHELWSRADAALYAAKAGGGLRIGRSRLAAPGAYDVASIAAGAS